METTGFCNICGNDKNNTFHSVREMYFGFREQFTYLECSACGCLHLLDIPDDLSKYYPDNYYSLKEDTKIKGFLRKRWSEYAYRDKNILGWFLSKIFFSDDALLSVKRLGISIEAKILDVGCGDGKFINELWYLGFRNLQGIDPYISQDILKTEGPSVYKTYLNQMDDKYDLIMLHHSFEHMENPFEIMQAVNDLIKDDGDVILRIPICSTYAWKHYGVNWVNLDAPRHIYLHTPKSISIIANRAGLQINKIIYEGSDRQFWGSEQYMNDIPLMDPNSLAPEVNTLSYLKSLKKIMIYKQKAKYLNDKQDGDLACFYLRKL